MANDTDLEFYRTQAILMRDEARAAELPNVRQRCLHAAEAWERKIDMTLRLRESASRRPAGIDTTN